ncbi:MAG: PQQ-binding-like beta-propeller repeat protein [Verrucomicrobiales bacterium]
MKFVPFIFALLSNILAAADWPQWRGPHSNGSSQEKGLPDKFSQTENVLWTAPMPGPAGSTPIILGDKAFVTAAVESRQKLVGLCLDANTGAVKWAKDLAEGYKGDDKSNYAGPSPATDGKIVVFFFGNGELIACDLAGKEVWRRNLQKDYGRFAFLWTFSTSPVLHEGKLYMQVLQRNVAFQGWGKQKGEPGGKNESYLLALDPANGKELWHHVRHADAVEESLESFTTPVPAKVGGIEQLLIAGGDALSGHDLASGRELWRWSTWNPDKIASWRLVPSPVVGDNVVLACAPKGSPVYAVKGGLKGSHAGENDGLAWRSPRNDEDMPSNAYKHVSSDVATPLFYKDHFFVLNGERQSLACVKPATGEVLWNQPLGGRTKIEASPTGADDKIFIIDHRGDVYVVKADPAKFELLGKIEMAPPGVKDIRSSIPIANRKLFIRTHDKLFCVGLTAAE